MMRGLVDIEWNDYGQAVPAFITIALMPLTYSIAYGIIGGLFTYAVVNTSDFLITKALEAMGLQQPPSEPPSPPAGELTDLASVGSGPAKPRD
eukprot:1531016-Rhodomonas_salina.1